ncbi:aspartyl protease family protein [Candidatus Woesearchaeota archaeon]|nr:aspartyl protease family protein [Candidatus Woesearchaeota archaeon]
MFGRVDFYVDTGSPVTFISQSDAFRLHVPVTSLPQLGHTKIGGSTYELRRIREIELLFKTEEEKLERITLPEFSVLIGTKKAVEEIQEANSIPSLLGTDFLTINKLALYFNPSKGEAYLEKE